MFTVGLSEIVLQVQDLTRAARFYSQVVGLPLEREPADGWAWFWTGSPGASPRLALRSGALLFEEQSPHPPDRRWGCVHYAFHVPRNHLDAAVAHLHRADVEVMGPIRLEWMDATAHYFYDPDGNLLEFWSPDPESTA